MRLEWATKSKSALYARRALFGGGIKNAAVVKRWELNKALIW